MPLGEERLCSIIESLLLVSAEPVPISRLVEVICTEDPSTEAEQISGAVQLLIERYAAERPIARGFRVEDVGGALQLRTVPDNGAYVRSFLSAKPQRLSKPALETLAIIAYRQPVTKPEIETIRGVDSGAVMKQLLERDLVRIIGKREEVGRPIIYGTTKYFLEFFGVRSLAELPTLREYHELDEEHQREVDALEQGPKENKLTDLASAASFLVEVKDDPDLSALDDAVAEADRARRAADFALDPTAGVEEYDADGRPLAPEKLEKYTVDEEGRPRAAAAKDAEAAKAEPVAPIEGGAAEPAAEGPSVEAAAVEAPAEAGAPAGDAAPAEAAPKKRRTRTKKAREAKPAEGAEAPSEGAPVGPDEPAVTGGDERGKGDANASE